MSGVWAGKMRRWYVVGIREWATYGEKGVSVQH